MNTKEKKNRPTAPAARSAKPAPRRGPKPAFSPAQIAVAAIRVADKDGLEAVTMQRIAGEVGLTAMALYRYFPGKAELIAIMIDSAGDSLPSFELPSAPWSDRLREWARCCAAIYRNHPWFLEATTNRRTLMGPNELSWMESALAMLTEAGLSPARAYNAFFALIGHIRAHAMFEQIAKQGASPRQWIRELSRLLQSQGAAYPTLQAALASGALDAGLGQALEFGLTCILDGIAVQARIRPRRGIKSNHAKRD